MTTGINPSAATQPPDPSVPHGPFLPARMRTGRKARQFYHQDSTIQSDMLGEQRTIQSSRSTAPRMTGFILCSLETTSMMTYRLSQLSGAMLRKQSFICHISSGTRTINTLCKPTQCQTNSPSGQSPMPNPSFKSMILMLFSRAHLISKTPGQPTQTANELNRRKVGQKSEKTARKPQVRKLHKNPIIPKR